MSNKVQADFVEQKIGESNWGIRDFLKHYNISSEDEFLKNFKKQYKFTPTRCDELIELMKTNDEKNSNAVNESEIANETVAVELKSVEDLSKAELVESVERIKDSISQEILNAPIEIPNNNWNDEIDKLTVESKKCSEKLVELKEKFKNLEEENTKQYETVVNVRKDIEKLLDTLNEKEAETYRCTKAIDGNLKKMEVCSVEMEECIKNISKIQEEIKAKQVVKIFCGNCNDAENYTEVWKNGTLSDDEIRVTASKYAANEAMDKFDDVLSMKQLRQAVEFFMLAKQYEANNNNKVEYTFENNNFKEVFDTLCSITIE